MLKKLRNILVVLFFTWSAGIGVLLLGIINTLSSLTLATSQVFLYGAAGGILLGGSIAGLIFFLMIRKLRKYKHLFFIFQEVKMFLRNVKH